MNFRKLILPAALVVSVITMAALPAFANHGGMGQDGKTCPMSGKRGMGGCDKGGSCAHMKGAGCSHASSPCPIATKFCGKVCWLMEHKTELGLTDDQVAQIKSLDLEVEKNSIRGMAEMQVFGLEIENRLSQDVVDVEGIESMIDSGMAGMATGAKATVKAYAELKTVLTDDQKAKAKELKKAGHMGHHHHGA